MSTLRSARLTRDPSADTGALSAAVAVVVAMVVGGLLAGATAVGITAAGSSTPDPVDKPLVTYDSR